MLERLGIKMTKTTKIYAWVLVLVLFAGAYTYFSSPSRAEVTQGSDGPVYLYDTNYEMQEVDGYSWGFSQEVYASESDANASDAFTCAPEATGAFTFIADRGQERAGTNGWNAAATQIFPSGSKNLLEVNFTPAANVTPLKLSQASIKTVGGQYSLGVACTTNNGVTVTNAWYRYIEVTPSTGEWTALPNGDGSEPVDPTLGQGVEGLTLTAPATADWVKNSVYYRVDPRTFSKSHNLDGVTTRIGILKAIGVSAIVLEPIFTVSQSGMPGSLGDIYAPSDTGINPDLGTDEELQALITTAHAAGIKVVITWVTSHVGNDSPWLIDHDDWFLRSGVKIAIPVGKPYASLLDYSVPAVRAAMMTDMLAWVKAFDFDGIASEAASGQPAEFWDEATNRVNQVRPVVFFTSTPVAADYLTHSFAAATRSDVVAAFTSLAKGTTASTTWNTLTKSLATANAKATNLNYVSDHKTAALGKSDATRLGSFLNSAIAFTYVAPGAPVVNAGQEIAYSKALKPFDSDNIVWPTNAPAATGFYAKLAKLRSSNPVILTGSTATVTTSVKTVFAMKRTSATGTVYYVANLTKKALTAKISFGKKGTVYDFATGKKLTIAASQNVKIPASGYLIYSTNLVK
jgi:glycosidase